MSAADPAKVLDIDDPGDDTQLRFRYQHGYGVILLCGASANSLPYIAVWCEHHEDLLGEKANGQYDSFQIKTATPESGPWKMGSEKLWKSVGRFVKLDEKFPGKIDSHSFVSNVQCYDTDQVDEVSKSPIKFFNAVQASCSFASLPAHFQTALKDLAKKIGCDENALFATCNRVRIVKGPALDAFETSIAHEHLPTLNGCGSLSPAELDGLRDELIQVVFRASSVAIDDPSKHWCCVLGSDHLNPRLTTKRLVVGNTIDDVISGRAIVFRFAPSTDLLKLSTSDRDLAILGKKLAKGGLATHLDTMQSRTLSAEQHLLAMVARDADEAGKVLNQLTSFVRGACDDAQAVASANPEPWGLDMYRRVLARLQNAADNQKDLVHHQPHECLMGVAGLLTEDCKVWWSPKFDLKEAI